MTVEEYLVSEEFEQYSIQSKLFELSLLELDDFNFDHKGSKLSNRGTIYTIKGQVTDKFLAEFEAQYGYESIFKGELVEIEIAYDRISKIAVYQKEMLDTFENVFESYRFEMVYLGPNISVPSYDNEKMKYEN